MPEYRNLAPGSIPAPLDVWRVTVRRERSAFQVGLEVLTLTAWDTSVLKVATDWTLRIHHANLGVIRAEPVIDEDAGLFVVDMQFDRSTPLVPASQIVARWEDMIPGTSVVRVERVPVASQSGAAAATGLSSTLQEAAKDSAAMNAGATIGNALSTAKWGFAAVLAVVGLVVLSRSGLLSRR